MRAFLKINLFCALIMISALFFYSCHPTYYIKITDISDPSRPCFSISQGKFLPWAEGMWNTLIVQEVDHKGNLIRPVWIIVPFQNVNVKNLCYGKAPEGYKEKIKAIPLELDKFYLFYPSGMGCYFRIVRKNEEMKAEIYTAPEFYHKVVYSEAG